MNIAFVSTILACPWGGADKLWTRAAEAAVAAGHSVLVAVSREVAGHPRMRQLADAGAQFYCRDRSTQPRGGRQKLADAVAGWSRRSSSIYVRLGSFSPAHVFICQGGTYDLIVEPGLLAWCRKLSIPFSVICQANGDTSDVNHSMRNSARQAFAAARAVFFVSRHNKELAERQLAAAIPNARLVQNPVELERQMVPWPTIDTACLAVVARIDSHQKGLDLLIEALGKSSLPPWRLNFYGRGPDELYLQELANRSAVAAHITFHGFVVDVAKIWASNHILLLPSRYEGCALAMLEALACGRPVLMTDVGGASDWIEHGQNGFVCSAAVPSLLGETLRTAMAARSHWEAMGKNALQSAQRLNLAPESDVLAVL